MRLSKREREVLRIKERKSLDPDYGKRPAWQPWEDQIVLSWPPAQAAKMLGRKPSSVYNRRLALNASAKSMDSWDAYTLVWMRDRGYSALEVAALLGRPRQTIYSRYSAVHSE